MKVQPLGDRVVAKPIEAETKSAAGILLPDSAKDRPQSAKVEAVGQDVKEVKVGDQILHSEYGPSKFKLNGEELLLIKEEDILAVVKG